MVAFPVGCVLGEARRREQRRSRREGVDLEFLDRGLWFDWLAGWLAAWLITCLTEVFFWLDCKSCVDVRRRPELYSYFLPLLLFPARSALSAIRLLLLPADGAALVEQPYYIPNPHCVSKILLLIYTTMVFHVNEPGAVAIKRQIWAAVYPSLSGL